MASLVRRILDHAAGQRTPNPADPLRNALANRLRVAVLEAEELGIQPEPGTAAAAEVALRAALRGTPTVPPLPRRGDHVEAWLKQQRDEFEHGDSVWPILDYLLDEYRLHADTGTPLHEHCCEGGNVHDCAGCYDAQKGTTS